MGLEIHLRLQTHRKLFSPSANQHYPAPNHHIDSYSLGYPGTLPQLNLQALKLATQLCTLLHFELAPVLHFDRKNYFYFDLPKGYQITQFYHPLGKNGQLSFFLSNKEKKVINLTSAHLEEDTAKSIYLDQQILADYNRSGMPLVEIVTEPDFTTFEEVELFLKTLIWTLSTAQISEMKFEEGSMRVDVNISQSLGERSCPRTEIKNLNSLKNIEKAIVEETASQQKYFHSLQKSCTKTFDESNDCLQFMRSKFSQTDYFFMRENNIAPIHLDRQQVAQWKQDVDWLIDFDWRFYQFYRQLTISEKEFIFSNTIYIFYFALLVDNLKKDLPTVILFLKQILQPLCQTLSPHSVNASSLNKRYSQNWFQVFSQEYQTKKSAFFLDQKQQLWHHQVTKALESYWTKFNQNSTWKLPLSVWTTLSQQHCLFDLKLVVELLQMYQKKVLSFKIVKEVLYAFTYQKILYFVEIKQFLLNFFTQSAIDLPTSTLIEQFLATLLKNDRKLKAAYQQFPQKTTNYLIGQIYRKANLTKPMLSKISPQTLPKIINRFFANLVTKKD